MSNDFDIYMRPIVMVTGFGPFVNHPVNASWEAVKLMNKEAIEDTHGVELVQQQISVTYEDVDEFVPALWETHEPKLMLHVGVNANADCFWLETQAHKKGYKRKDYLEQLPANQVCSADGAIRLHTKLNVERICKEFNDLDDDALNAVPSLDAGRYLCEYIYYTSLSRDKARTLFVHVPDTGVSAPARTARALEAVLALCLRQIDEAGGAGGAGAGRAGAHGARARGRARAVSAAD